MSATISDCGKYRYTLTRKTHSILRWNKPCLFIMLNPSTADAKIDDPTIKKCLHYARREGCTDLTVVNLFALRATDPQELLKHDDPTGSENWKHILDQIQAHRLGLVVLAWGSHKFIRPKYVDAILFQLFRANITPKCLAINQDGNPRHPLYVPKDQKLIDFELKHYEET